MISRIFASGLLALVVVCTGASAQQTPKAKAPKGWMKEPSAVFGIRLGDHLTDAQIDECGGIKNSESRSEIKVCRLPYSSTTGVAISGFPINEFQTGLVLRRDGVAVAISIDAKHDDYDAVRAILVERYGAPTSTTKQAVQTKAGASFTSEKLSWSGRALQLTLDERAGTIEKSSVQFLHIPSMTLLEGEAAAKRKAAAANM